MEDMLKIMGEFRKITGVTPRFDGILSVALSKKVVDTIKLDEALSVKDPEYDCKNATYKGEECSMGEYIKKKYGDRAYDLAVQML